MNKKRKVWINGKYYSESEAKVSIYDSALTFGDMVFEMTRSFNKKQFKLREHLERMYMGINILKIPLKTTIDEMEKIVFNVIEMNEPAFERDEHRLMIEVTRGVMPVYQMIDGLIQEPNIIIADVPLRWSLAPMYPMYTSGINAIIPKQRSIPSNLLDPKIKTRSRLHYRVANLEMELYPGKNNWALLTDDDGFITEGTGENFFIVKNNVVYTPEGRNILRGISRSYIFELCKELKIECVEKNIEPYDVHNADEAFYTGTRFCLIPCTSLNMIKIGNGKMGIITKALLDKWSETVGLDILEQIKEYNTI